MRYKRVLERVSVSMRLMELERVACTLTIVCSGDQNTSVVEGPGGMVEDATGPLSGWTYLRSMPWRRSAHYKFFVLCCWHTSSRSRAMSADLARGPRASARD